MEKRITLWITEQNKGTVHQVLRRELHLTEHQIRSAKFRENGICVNGTQVRVTDPLHPGDHLEVLLETDAEAERKKSVLCCHACVNCSSGAVLSGGTFATFPKQAGPMDIDSRILYEDEDVLVLNKPAGIVVHPTHGHYGDTITDQLGRYFRQRGEQVVIRSIGRLDKDTSGALLFAKNQVAAARLWSAEQKNVKKEYLALVQGLELPPDGCIDQPIEKCPDALNRMQVSAQGQRAVTHYQVLKQYPASDCSLLRLWLETGRTHQIRVHMAYIGHPLLGDPIYGAGAKSIQSSEKLSRTVLHCSEELTRTALHCRRITFYHPFTGKIHTIAAPLPADMEKVMGEVPDGA